MSAKKKHYLDHPEAREWIEKNEKEFNKLNWTKSVFPTKGMDNENKQKLLLVLNNLHLLKGKSLLIMQHVAAGFSNEQIQKDFKFKSLHAVETRINKLKTSVLKKLEKQKNDSFRQTYKYKPSIANPLAEKQFQFGGQKQKVYLIKVPFKYRLRAIPLWDSETVFYYQQKFDLLRFELAGAYPDSSLLTNKITIASLYKRQQRMLDDMGQYRWVDSKGNIFTGEIDMLITLSEHLDKQYDEELNG